MVLFTIEDMKPVPTSECMALIEVQELMKLGYNKRTGDSDGRKRERGIRELIFIYFSCDYRSEFSNYPDEERDRESLLAAGLSEDHPMSIELLAAIGAITHHINKGNRVLNLLNSARSVVDKLHKYFNSVQLEIDEKDTLEKQKMKSDIAGKIMDNLDKVPRVIKNLDTVEERVRKEQGSGTRAKGDAETGRLQ